MKRKTYIRPQTEVVAAMHHCVMKSLSFPVKEETPGDGSGNGHGGGEDLDELPTARNVNLWDDPGELWR